jgi:hypothetical protein
MLDPNSKRFAGMAMFAFVVVSAVAFIVFIPSGLPNSGEPASKVTAYVTEHRSALLTSAFLQGFAAIPFLMFVASAVTMMRRAEGETGMWSMLTALGGAVAVALALVACTLAATLVYRAAAGDAGLARTLLDANFVAFGIGGFPLAVFIWATTQGLVSAGMVARWMAPLGMLAALALVVGGAAFAKGDGFFSPQGGMGYVAAFAFLGWGLLMGVSLMREHAPVAAAHPPATPAAA